jgi:hypothetical protein
MVVDIPNGDVVKLREPVNRNHSDVEVRGVDRRIPPFP